MTGKNKEKFEEWYVFDYLFKKHLINKTINTKDIKQKD